MIAYYDTGKQKYTQTKNKIAADTYVTYSTGYRDAFNLYGYVTQRPTSATDPMGLAVSSHAYVPGLAELFHLCLNGCQSAAGAHSSGCFHSCCLALPGAKQCSDGGDGGDGNGGDVNGGDGDGGGDGGDGENGERRNCTPFFYGRIAPSKEDSMRAGLTPLPLYHISKADCIWFRRCEVDKDGDGKPDAVTYPTKTVTISLPPKDQEYAIVGGISVGVPLGYGQGVEVARIELFRWWATASGKLVDRAPRHLNSHCCQKGNKPEDAHPGCICTPPNLSVEISEGDD